MRIPDIEPIPCLQGEDLSLYARSVDRFYERHAQPHDVQRWRDQKVVDRGLWIQAGEAGLLGVSVPEVYGGGGGDFRHEVAIIVTQGHYGAEAFGIGLHNPVVLPYITAYGTEAQKHRWLPPLCRGEMISAIAMTEPGAGSDLRGMSARARRTANGYAITGQKTFISNGQTANLIIVAAKTDSDAGNGRISLFIVEPDKVARGFERGRNLDKIGQEGQDTSELFFDDVEIPEENLLGSSEGLGFEQLMQKLPQERLVIAWQSLSMMERALAVTLAYAKERSAFGRHLIQFQNTQFVLAECKTEITIAKVFVNHCTELLLDGKLDETKAAMAKYWVSETQTKVIDRCLQLFGGYGYMNEYPIALMYKDCRIHRIYGGTTEIMKQIIGRKL